jgi:dUTP pyrophosphatase
MFEKGIVVPLSLSDDLSQYHNSRKMAHVRCQRCNEVFIRERCDLHKFHACPTHITKDGAKFKLCDKCQKFLTYDNFRSGESLLCVTCINKNISWFNSAISNVRLECGKSGVPFDISMDDLLKLYDLQGGRCVYSGVMLEFDTNSSRHASVECVDPVIGYVRGNVVLVSRVMNWIKNNDSDIMALLLEISGWMASSPVRLEFKKTHEDAVVPQRSRVTDAGYDIVSIDDVVIKPKVMTNVRTGIIVCAPPGYYFTIEGRSSLWMKGVIPFRGIIDATYQGQLMVAMTNGSDSPYIIHKGDRIAQIILHKAFNIDFNEVDDFTPVKNGRGAAGFGSSGR